MTTLYVSSFTHVNSTCSCVVTVGSDLSDVILNTCTKREGLTGEIEIDTFKNGNKVQTRFYKMVDGVTNYVSTFLHTD